MLQKLEEVKKMAEKVSPDVISDEELPSANILRGSEVAGKFLETTISAVGLFQLKDGSTARTLTVNVNGTEKSFILNRSNKQALVEAYGKNTRDWVGKHIRITSVKRLNPKTGMQVDGILVLPA